MMHIYAFTLKPSSTIPYYERTFGCARTAERWANRQEGRFVSTKLPALFWY